MDVSKIGGLYDQVLVQLNDDISRQDLPVIKVEKEVVVFHDTNENAFTPELKKMLSNLIKALKLEADQVEQHWITNSFSLSKSLSASNTKHVLVFGLSPRDLHLQLSPKHHVVHRFQQFSLLFSYGLEELMLHSNMKRELWSALKEQFEIH